MKSSKFSDAQKAFIIRHGEDGTPVEECQSASKRDPLSASNRDPLVGFRIAVTSAPFAGVGA